MWSLVHAMWKLNSTKLGGGYELNIIEIASRMGGWRDVLIKHSYGIDYLSLLLKSSLKQEFALENKKAENFCLVKMIYTKKDYEFYQFIKTKKPNLIVKEQLFIKENESFTYSSSLMDVKGYYYLKLDLSENIDRYIKQDEISLSSE